MKYSKAQAQINLKLSSKLDITADTYISIVYNLLQKNKYFIDIFLISLRQLMIFFTFLKHLNKTLH